MKNIIFKSKEVLNYFGGKVVVKSEFENQKELLEENGIYTEKDRKEKLIDLLVGLINRNHANIQKKED